jgi:hypothetical protein
VPAGAEGLTLLETTLLGVLDVEGLMDKDVDEALEDDFTVLVTRVDNLELVAAVVGFELIEGILELEGGITLLTLLLFVLAHTSCVCPISHAPFILNDSNTIASIAFKFAPVNELSGTVTVCVDPVAPVTVW